MARPPGTLRVGRYLMALVGIFVVLYAAVLWPGQRHKPKLGIDLVGGIRVIYTALGKTDGGQMDVARQIMEDRVNSTGVTGSTVQVQGNNQILILIPNGTGQDVKNLGAAAKLNFRPLVAPAVPVTCGKYAPAGLGSSPSKSSGSKSPSPSSTTSSSPAKFGRGPDDARHLPLAAPTSTSPRVTKSATGKTSATPKASSSAAASASPSASSTQPAISGPGKCTTKPFTQWLADNKGSQVPLTDTDFDKLSQSAQTSLVEGKADASGRRVGGLTNFDCDSALAEPDRNSTYYVACGDGINPSAPKQKYAFLMGKVIVAGPQITDANAQAPNGSTTEWTVSLQLNNSGNKAWGDYTTKHNIQALGSSNQASATNCSATTFPCADFVAFTLNGEVISSPVNQEPINGQATQITGGWGQDPTGAKALAKQLQYGSLPLTFKLASQDPVSATLGKSQLHAAFLAGGIGLFLVVVYSLIYYRALGLVTIASLVVSAGLVYAMLVILGTHMGFTLDLAGVTGFIVALGITADSFVVFFERIKDEVHDGRSLRVAVPRAWVRARRTILSADTVSFLAAAVLYFFASADVQGFAFTLGLSTVLDLIVVFLFTHPVVSLLSRSKAFGSPRFTGLQNVRAGGIVAPSADDERAVARASRAPRRSATAVLEKRDVEQDAPAEVEPETDGPDAPPAAEEPRRRTQPRGGTAAERAAERRARMRERGEGDNA